MVLLIELQHPDTKALLQLQGPQDSFRHFQLSSNLYFRKEILYCNLIINYFLYLISHKIKVLEYNTTPTSRKTNCHRKYDYES